MENKEKATEIFARLEKKYPVARSALDWETPWELLVATVLAAQCTDVRVNKVTPFFFKKWPSIEALSKAETTEIEEVIRSTGFFRNKAKNLKAAAEMIQKEYAGEVPKKYAGSASFTRFGQKNSQYSAFKRL